MHVVLPHEEFSSKVKGRAARYFTNGQVSIESLSASYVEACVSNGYDHSYQVQVAFDTNGRMRSADCECPHFADGNYCKHVWATILQAAITELKDESGAPPTGMSVSRSTIL